MRAQLLVVADCRRLAAILSQVDLCLSGLLVAEELALRIATAARRDLRRAAGQLLLLLLLLLELVLVLGP